MGLSQVGDTLSWSVDTLPCYSPGSTFPGSSSHVFVVILWQAEFRLGGVLVATGVFGVNATDGVQTSSSNLVTILAGGTCDMGVPGSLLWSESSSTLPNCGFFGSGPGHVVGAVQMQFSPDLETAFDWDFVSVQLSNLCTEDVQVVPSVLFNRTAYSSGASAQLYSFNWLFGSSGGGASIEDCVCEDWTPRVSASRTWTARVCQGSSDWVTQQGVIVTQGGLRVTGR